MMPVVTAMMVVATAIKATRETVTDQACGSSAKDGSSGLHHRARAAILVIHSTATDTHRDHGSSQDETVEDGFHAR
jgi:hypothetical protein